MRKIVEQILNGNYVSESGSLDFSCTKIELSAVQGETVTGSFVIKGELGTLCEGHVFSTDYRMECLTPEFSGSEAEIAYQFHGEGVEEGEVVKGAFRISSLQGEYSLPYVVNCEPVKVNSSMGPIKNLFHFTNLAKTDWQEALSLFYSPDFIRILTGSEAAYIPCYRGLSQLQGQEQNLEEFLIHVGKKQCVEFWAEQPEISLEILTPEGEYHLAEQEITVVRSGWGYTALNVECDGGFLFAEKAFLREEDFLGNYARVPIYIDRSGLNAGMNFGKVVFYNSFVSFEVNVSVKIGVGHVWSPSAVAGKKAIVSLMGQYEAFRTKKISLAGWLKETSALVEKMIALDEDAPAPRLYKAQLLITQNRENEASWLLAHARNLMEANGGVNDELWAYYLYLTTLISREEEQIQKVTAEVEMLYKQNPCSWRIAWLLLYLSEEYSNLPAVKVQFLERQFERGSNSFVLYIEALQVYNNNPAMLRKLGRFEQQVMHYGISKDYVSPELAERFLELLEKNKEYSPVLCKSLKELYEKKQDKRIVQEMCRLYAKGSVTGPEALPWYERGVEEQLRITNLYELYMMSIDPDNQKKLPKAAVLYFSYQNNLDYKRTAFLYNYVISNQALYADVYDKYMMKARDFVWEQVAKGHITRQLSELYVKFITPDTITQQNCENIMKLLFVNQLYVHDTRMKKAILYAGGSIVPREYPLTEGEAFIPIYGNDFDVVFEDAFGNRFADNISYELEKYVITGRYITELAKYEMDCPEFDLFLVREKMDAEGLDGDLQTRAIRLCRWGFLEPSFQKKLCLKLVKQFYEEDKTEQLGEMLALLNKQELTLEERTEVIRYLVLQGDYATAYDWVQEFGPYFVDANTLARLVSSLIADQREGERALIFAATYLFRRGKHNAAMLDYLSRWAGGSSKELRDIWKEIKASGLDSSLLEEKILIQLLYTGAYVGEKAQIFESYYQSAGATDVTQAFVVQSCYEFFVREKLTDGSVLRIVLDYYKWGAPIQKVCKLAFLKYYAENPQELTKEINGALDSFLREMLAEKIHFAFYDKLKLQGHLLGELSDKVIVEYRTRPGGHARIHYVVSQENGAEQEYLSENMRDVFGGVCCKEFVLFFGETLQYYITEEVNGEEQFTESGKLQCSESDNTIAGSKFSMINEMVISSSMQDYETFDSDLETYYFKEFCGENLFVLH